jgi:hypothetical protein
MKRKVNLIWFDLGDKIGIRPGSAEGRDWFLKEHGINPSFWDTSSDPLLYPHDTGAKVLQAAIKYGLKVRAQC